MRKQFVAIAAMTLLLAGCGQEETILPEGGGTALCVTSRIEASALTKAVNDQWTAGDAIGIYQLDPGQSTVEISNRKYETTAGDGNFSPTGEGAIYLPVNGATRDFIAYYPWQASKTDEAIYYGNLTNQADQEAIDLMVAAKVTGVDKNNPNAQFTFSHKLSKLNLSITAGAGLSAADLAGLTVKITNTQNALSYNLLTDELTLGAQTSITLHTATDGLASEGIVCPNEGLDSMELAFTLKSGETFSWPLGNSTAGKFEAGKKYLYKITINRVGLEVTSQITDWIAGNGENGESGSAE
ncbi:fimbrillin family protein [Parabacteroides sp.]